MNPVHFPEQNCVFGPPEGIEECQVKSIPAFTSKVITGSLDGCQMIIVAWLPTVEELEEINKGNPIFLTMIGGLCPHYLSTSFKQASTPS